MRAPSPVSTVRSRFGRGFLVAVPALLELLAAGGGDGDRSAAGLCLLLCPSGAILTASNTPRALVPALPRLESAGIAVLAIGIARRRAGSGSCAFTGVPLQNLLVKRRTPAAIRALGLCEGLQQPGGACEPVV